MDLLELGEFLEAKRKRHRPMGDDQKCCLCGVPRCEVLEMVVAVDVLWNIIGDQRRRLDSYEPREGDGPTHIVVA